MFAKWAFNNVGRNFLAETPDPTRPDGDELQSHVPTTVPRS